MDTLELCVSRGDYEAVERLLLTTTTLTGPDALRGPRGRTLLHSAVGRDHVHVARLLLDHGADVDAVTEDRLTPLHIAVANRSRAMVAMLLRRGASVELPPERRFNGKTPLYMAVEYGCPPEIVEVLLARGASLEGATMCSPAGTSALHVALRIGEPVIAELLLGYASAEELNGVDSLEGKTPLHLAITQRLYDIVPLMLERGASLCGGTIGRDDDDDAAAAANPDDDYCCGYDYDYGGDAVASDPNYGPLDLAVDLGDARMVELLLKASKNSINSYNSTNNNNNNNNNGAPTTIATITNRDHVIGCLERAVRARAHGVVSAIVSAVPGLLHDRGDGDVLYHAVRNGDLEMMALLVERGGAPVNGPVNCGGPASGQVTCLDVAVKSRSVAATKLLLRHGGQLSSRASPEERAFALKYKALLEAQLRRGPVGRLAGSTAAMAGTTTTTTQQQQQQHQHQGQQRAVPMDGRAGKWVAPMATAIKMGKMATTWSTWTTGKSNVEDDEEVRNRYRELF